MLQLELSDAQATALEERLRALKPDKVATLLSRAARRAGERVKTEGWKNISRVYTMKQEDVYKYVSVISGPLGTTVYIRSPIGVGAEKFSHSFSPGRGLSLAVKKGRRRLIPQSYISSAFFKKYKKGWGVTYFSREGTRSYPLSRLFGPSVTQMFQNENVIDKVEDVGMQTYVEQVQRQIDLVIRGLE